ncbi:MAG: NUDIX domain-containing protein [Clostridia bacterium]|nr:NUDIX domain-containing protein [Clostridia bacterium]
MENKNCETIEQISKTYTAPYREARTSCRAIIVADGKILLSHESKTGFYMSPGGSLEEGETFEECVVREVMEETGFAVSPVKHFVTVNEYCYDILYISQYFICEIVGEGERALTETEVYKGMVPKWVGLNDAVDIFGTYKKHTPDKESLYLRELTVINRYMQSEK